MKKVLFVLMAAMAILTVSSCKKDKTGGGDDNTAKIPVATYRVKAVLKDFKGDDMYSGDAWKFTWNSNGTISKIDLDWNKETYSSVVFSYSGNTATAVDAKKENKPVYEITLNDKNLATKIVNKGGEDYGGFSTLECTYDANGFLTKAIVNGKLSSLQQIDENGDVEFWTRIGVEAQISESLSAPGWRKKMHTYYSAVNAAGIHGEWNEDTGVGKRWLYESGLLGRASAHVMRTAWWYGVVKDGAVSQEYATKLAYYPLDVDANSCVKSETKCYDSKEKYENDPSTMAPEGSIYFVCEKIN